ncbi:hypothetical protein BDY21DRAFT_278699 [Lineolata rhizophorae]|uniref:Nucleotidylyl transferase n=1 Tax=Lineolata rhizophorae TaxID=578093 RepID=A0A6A6PC79_9PEZI|nr:hypothetical protein BDY21DRAFT_278699 [Lineolata rhizophorae]
MALPSAALRVARARALLPRLESALQDFTTTSAEFRIIHTTPIPPSSSSDDTTTTQQQQPQQPHQPPPTLFILDSSYNPPSLAHFTLATSALLSFYSSPQTPPPPPSTHPPARLLLLFAVRNADKATAATTPAPFPHRLAMLTLFADDVSAHLSTQLGRRGSRAPPSPPPPSPAPAIDIALTSHPTYVDKTAAIAASPAYPPGTAHVHLLGHDTLTRLFSPRYYAGSALPLAALRPYFAAGHRLRVTLRPTSASAEAAPVEGEGEDEGAAQRAFVERLARGDLEPEGASRAWAAAIEVVEGEREALGVSSTAVREACRKGDWEAVGRMCSEGVSAWVREVGEYR